MIRAFYSAQAGLSAMQSGIDVVSNNVANANTDGFRAARADFTSLMNASMNDVQGADTTRKAGAGAKVGNVNVLFGVGTRMPTGRANDFAIDGESGFFAIQEPDGTRTYTRAGSFQERIEGNNTYLISSSGGYVLDAGGQKIEVLKPVATKPDKPGNPDKPGGGAGTATKPKVQAVPGVYLFKNNGGLEQIGGTSFIATELSGAAAADKALTVTTGAVESSGTNMVGEMSGVLQLQRSFQFNSRMVQIADEIMQNINQLR